MLHLWSNAKAQTLRERLAGVLEDIRPRVRLAVVENGVPVTKAGDVVLALGADACEHLQSAGAIPKNRKIASLRGTVITSPHGSCGGIILTWAPGAAAYDAVKAHELQWDARLAKRLLLTGTTAPKVGHYVYVDDFSEVIAGIEAQYAQTGKRVRVVGDTETVGLDYLDPGKRIVTFQCSYMPGKAWVYRVPQTGQPPPEVLAQIFWLHTSEKVSMGGANYKYDLNWMYWKWGIECTNFRFDTMLVGSLLDENRHNGLKTHACDYTDMGGYETEFESRKGFDKGRMDRELELNPEGFLIYSGGDVDAGLQVRLGMEADLKKQPRLARFYTRVMHPGARAFEKVEQRGMVVDLKQYEVVRQTVQADITTLRDQIEAMLPARLRMKYAGKLDDEGKLKVGLPSLLKDFMFTPYGLNLKPRMYTEKAKAQTVEYASTAMEHLEMFRDTPEALAFVKLLKDYNSAQKTMSTYIVGFLSHVRSDGKFHPTYFLARGEDAGTVTGRSSARDPAVQTIPKHTKYAKLLRSVYRAPPGYVILQPDFSQGELRIAADLANESVMIRAYLEKKDLHTITACKVSGITLEQFHAMPKHEQKELRFRGKPVNFGLLYGMSPAGFVDFAWKGYGLNLSLTDAERYSDGFFALYPALRPWHEKYKSMARRFGAVVSPLGRIRHLPNAQGKDEKLRSEALRQAVNSPVQSALSDLAQLAMAELYGIYPDLNCFLMTHDELSYYAPEDNWEKWNDDIIEVMENLPTQKYFGWTPKVPLIAEGSVGYVMSEMYEPNDYDKFKALAK